MGNCCGSQAVDDSPSAPVRATRTQPIARATGPGQTLGGPSGGPADPRTAAAIAAEQRNQEAAKGGKLASQLQADRSKTSRQHLQDASVENRQAGEQELRWD